jgi:hypothetical protein
MKRRIVLQRTRQNATTTSDATKFTEVILVRRRWEEQITEIEYINQDRLNEQVRNVTCLVKRAASSASWQGTICVTICASYRISII